MPVTYLKGQFQEAGKKSTTLKDPNIQHPILSLLVNLHYTCRNKHLFLKLHPIDFYGENGSHLNFDQKSDFGDRYLCIMS
ncbi:hypothetical protein FKM82_001695 [Ascaphus truei]